MMGEAASEVTRNSTQNVPETMSMNKASEQSHWSWSCDLLTADERTVAVVRGQA
jgi:hypothetical protein